MCLKMYFNTVCLIFVKFHKHCTGTKILKVDTFIYRDLKAFHLKRKYEDLKQLLYRVTILHIKNKISIRGIKIKYIQIKLIPKWQIFRVQTHPNSSVYHRNNSACLYKQPSTFSSDNLIVASIRSVALQSLNIWHLLTDKSAW